MKINIIEKIGGSRRILILLNYHKLFKFFKNNENFNDIFELLKISENKEDISYIFNLLNVSWYSLTLQNEIVKNEKYYENINLIKKLVLTKKKI